MFDLISIGDSTIDTLMEIHDAEVNCTIHKERCVFCINYADKIPVHQFTRTVAGNAANNAVGGSRLGLKTAIYTHMGDDDQGNWIRAKLIAEGVSPKYIKKDKDDDSLTNASTVINFKGERTILVYHAPRTYKLPPLGRAAWAYYTSVSKDHLRLNREVVAWVRRNKVKLAHNPGTFQLKAGYAKMKQVLKVSEILFVNKEEAARIVGAQHSVRHYLMALHARGPKIVVITDGPNGSFAFDGKSFYQMGIVKAPVVERTGAGDSFASAFVAARHYGKTIPEAMCWGSLNSASVIGKIGPQAGLLTKKEIERQHHAKSHTCATVF